jgi:RHS repeat-associated protein
MASLLVATPSASAARPTAGAVTPERLKLPSGPSSVRGLADEPSIDPFYAQLNYQVPIELPAGRGGLTPRLALTYSGALGNGPLGIGWTLGQPKIQRTTRFGMPRFSDSDELEISGIASGRLVSIGNGEYRVEGMGQTVRVRRVDGGFEVDDGRGVHYRLGTSPASRQESDPAHSVAWLVEDETNLMGERIRFEYNRDRNQLYPTRITWGPSDVYSVALVYESRGDQTTSYRSGFAVVTAQHLKAIEVTAAGVEQRRYQLWYDPTFPVVRLASVTATGVGRTDAWPTLTFSYAAPAAPVITPITGIDNWRLNGNGTTLVDLDGDGAAELLQLADGGHSYRTNLNGVFTAPQSLSGNTQSITALQLQDVDGDGRPELVQNNNSGWLVWKFSKTKWIAQTGVWPGSAGLALKQPNTTRFADLNGDGLVDAIQWNNDNLKIYLATPTGIGAPTLVGKIGGAVLPVETGRFQDSNGDGLDDYLVAASDHLDVYLGHGDGTFEPALRVAYPFAGAIVSAEDIELADLDRDGLLDLLKIDQGTVRWFRGNADGTFATVPVTLTNPEQLSGTVVVAVADSNGNGSQDVVWSSVNGMWRMDLAGATTAGMLTRVQNGLGLDVTFDYQSSHALAVAALQSGSAWGSNVQIAIPVPVKKTSALGPGDTTRVQNYSVRDGFWDPAEQRFGGFLSTIVTTSGATPAETSTVITRYNKGTGSNRELRGTPLIEQVLDGTGKRLSVTSTTWQTMAVAGLPDVPLLRRAVLVEKQIQYEDTTPVRQTDEVFTYDALGRANHVVHNGRTDLTGDESVTDTSYGDDDTTWVRDQMCETKLSSAAGELVSDTQVLFGDAETVQPLCAVGKGWPRETRAWLSSENRFVTQSQTRYDSSGNPIALIANGVERRVVYDANGLFPIEEHLTAPVGELVWRASWDPVLGVMTAVTDPNGHTSHLGYDSLGRYASTALDDRLPHSMIEYDWTAPAPKTIVWTFDGPVAELAAKPAAWSAASHWRQTVDVANGRGELRYRALRSAADQWIISSYRERDSNSRVVFAGRPVYAAQLEQTARPTGMVGDQLRYDPLGRLIAQQLPTGGQRTYSYTAFERTMQDADLAPVHSVIDGQGRAILTERSLADGSHEIVQATYDAAGRLTQMSLANGAVVRDFGYDTLGRLIRSHDPDLGTRTLAYDDGNRLTQEVNGVGQVSRYSYDALGRLTTRDAGSVYQYHYDSARPGSSGGNVLGRLAWVEEPTGGLELGYDEAGQTALSRHRIDDQVSEMATSYTASGLVLGNRYDDGFAINYHYDAAGRIVGANDLWQVLELDAGGLPVHERAGNGVDTRFTRDLIGQVSEVNVRSASAASIYDVRATRNAWSAITAIADLDGVGLDHTAQFSYDGFARLTGATLGSGAAGFAFDYRYDALHNMTSRTATGPHGLSQFLGNYHYAEAGHAPRQLTSITDAAGAISHSFNYDAAGRQIAQDQLVLRYDPIDRLTRVDGVAGGSVVHSYGQDGLRIKTVAPDGSVSYLFGDGTALRSGVREHDVTVGDRVVARVASAAPTAAGGAAPAALGGTTAGLGGRLVGLAVALGLAWLCMRNRRSSARPVGRPARPARRYPAWRLVGHSISGLARATGFTGLALALSCSPPGVASQSQSLAFAGRATFLHTGFTAGPTVFTDADGNLLEERRYEPFGAPIDAAIDGVTVAAPDIAARDLNPLNKRSDATTGWSDHGARWMAPETARWLTPDPPVEGPSAKFMFAPWSLHPYQFVNQNPVAYWDPDGNCAAPVLGPGKVGICVEAFIAAPRIGPLGVGHGDNRGFASNDPTKTSKIQQQITVDLASHALSNQTHIAVSTVGTPQGVLPWLGAVTYGFVNPFGVLGNILLINTDIHRAASGDSRISNVVNGAQGTTFTAGGHAVNGFTGLPAAPKGSIDYAFNFKVDAAGEVSLEGGVHKGYPSYGIYAYKLDDQGNLVTRTLYESKERELSDLQHPFDGLKDQPPNAPGVTSYTQD